MSESHYGSIISIDFKVYLAPDMVYLPMCWKLGLQGCDAERAESLKDGIYRKVLGFWGVPLVNVQVSPENELNILRN